MRTKRVVDAIIAAIGLTVLSPVLLLVAFAIWTYDRKSPIYKATRIGKNSVPFTMYKFRSMVVNAEKSGVDSTSASDSRITFVGKWVRRFKIDELPQLWNVLTGSMSLVGPRPNVQREVHLYSQEEMHLLDVSPGITDFASIVFADEGQILDGSDDPDISYNQLIRPGKNYLGLHYVKERTLLIDIRIVLLTILAIVSRARALDATSALIKKTGGSQELVLLALRKSELQPTPPPGFDQIITTRTI
jgi:lipopolysaccharide/colanic/teichoic acid biosynthesis glycosyltransferase